MFRFIFVVEKNSFYLLTLVLLWSILHHEVLCIEVKILLYFTGVCGVLFNFSVVLVFFLLAVAFVFGVIVLGAIIRLQKPSLSKKAIYECGEPTIGKPWIRYNIRFYTLALVYLIFDIELIFLFPVAIHVKELGMLAFFEIAFFVIVLIIGLIYAWKNGNLDWIQARKETKSE